MKIGRLFTRDLLHEGRDQKTGAAGLILRSHFWIIMVLHFTYRLLVVMLLIILQF
jgi:hypothetical protein